MRINIAIGYAAANVGNRRELAARLGVTERTIYNWATGKRAPSLWAGLGLAYLAGVMAEQLEPASGTVGSGVVAASLAEIVASERVRPTIVFPEDDERAENGA